MGKTNIGKAGLNMKILLLGSLISAEQMEQLNLNSKEKASVAPVNYETMLAKGLVENGAEVNALSVPAVAAYPHSIYKHIEEKQETIKGSIRVQWVPFVNVQGLKQISIQRNVERLLEQWLEENRDIQDKIVLMYSIYPPYSEPAVRLCRKHGCHLCAVIADLPEYMYSWKNMKGFRGWYSRRLSEKMLELQGQCDSYILFTQPMAAKMGIENKPYMVSEGFCDAGIFDDIPEQEKYTRKTIVYGGNLSRLYGIQNLVKGFMQTDLDAELHLYGAGGDAEFIKECAKQDSRIKFFGRVYRKTLLVALKRAHLLVVNKPTSDDYSNYSFSSKILEYMASGTPLLTTKVGGMPEEYWEHCYFFVEETCEGIASAIQSVTEKSPAELRRKGMRAKQFAIEQKNCYSMVNRITDFLKTQIVARETDGESNEDQV